MEKRSIITFEHGLFVGAFVISIAVRLLNLGQLSLSDLESQIAYQAYQLAGGTTSIKLEAQPAYLTFTSLMFFVFGSDNFAARLLPAISGALLSLTPFGFRTLIGRKPAVVLAFLFALDPGWLAISRQADGYSFAAVTLLFGLACIYSGKYALAGFFLGLALLGGPGLWQGIFILLLAIVLYKFVFRIETAEQESILNGFNAYLKPLVLWIGGTALVIGSLFLILPNNLSGITASFWEYLTGWGRTSGVSVLHLPLALLVYQPMSLLLGSAQAIRSARSNSKIDRFLTVWMLAAFVIVLVYPSRQVTDLGWVLLPMLALASRMFSDLLYFKFPGRNVAIVQALCVFFLLVFAWLNLMSIFRPIQGNIEQQVRGIGMVVSLLLILAAFFLVRWGWSTKVSTYGTLWGVLAAMILMTVSAAWSAGGLGQRPETQLWRTAPFIAEEDLLRSTIGDVSEWNTGTRDRLDLAVVNLSSPSIKWALRLFPYVEFFESLPRQESPSMVLTRNLPTLELASTYRGQDFSWEVHPTWSLMLGEDWLKWSLRKTANVERDLVLLWVREDIFPGWEESQE